MVPLPDVELEEGCVDEVGCSGEKAQLKGKLEAFCDVLVRLVVAGHVRREGHHCVERQQECVKEQPCYVVEPLVENDSPEVGLFVLSTLVVVLVGRQRVVAFPAGVRLAFRRPTSRPIEIVQ